MSDSQRSGFVYRALARPEVYDGLRWLLAPEQVTHIRKRIARTIPLSRTMDVLDLGCGTGLFAVSGVRRYVGLDIEHPCLVAAGARTGHHTFLTASAASLPFPDDSFDLIYSVGLYHHMTDDGVKRSLRDCWRCVRPGGGIVVMDAIWPTLPINLPAYLIRKLDRGAMIRNTAAMEKLVADALDTNVRGENFYFSYYFLQGCSLTIPVCDK